MDIGIDMHFYILNTKWKSVHS